ncbi:MAG: nucleotidyltransferase family protein [Opitutae bacterium]|nr:nucleotidyltransferase family protein [Opitutae bacterium]
MNVTPEQRFLLQLTRAALGRTEAHLDPVGVSWPRFIAEVDRHRLAPFLQRHVAPLISAHCPPPVAQQIHAASAETTRRSLQQTGELFRLLKLLADASVPAFAVKGVALSQQLHGSLGGRFAGDVDLVVAPEHALRADAVLQAAGLRRTRPEQQLTPRQSRAFIALKPEFEYLRLDGPGGALRVELLWRLEGIDALGPRANVSLGGRETRTLALEDHALFLLQHGARHAWFRLFWLVDIVRLLQRPELDWSALHARARAAGSDRALRQGVALAAELLGAPLPPALAHISADASLLAEARRQLGRAPVANETALEWARQLHYRTGLARGLTTKWRVLAPHVFSPASWQMWQLPDRWFWLYYPATPFLWLWRYVRRS